MTRNQLLYKICPTDMTFDCRTGNKSCNCYDCGRVLNKWLDEYDKQIRADAIDDFTKRLKAECREHYIDCEPCFGGIVENILYEDDIEEIAEQLKAGGDNE